MKITRPLNLTLFALNAALIVAAAHWLGCATPTRHEAPRAPGMYGLTGWGGNSTWRDGNTNKASDLDVSGTVGSPLYVQGCRAEIVPSNVGWTANHRVLTGELPPGMHFSDNGSTIEGVPTERGHWIVTLELYDIKKNDEPDFTYFGIIQTVRFHITGSGEVHQ